MTTWFKNNQKGDICRKHGEWAMCVGHTGDGHHPYIPLAVLVNNSKRLQVWGRPDEGFSEYGWGKVVGRVSGRNFHLIAAGEKVTLAKNDIKVVKV